jgi:hypothetical protein
MPERDRTGSEFGRDLTEERIAAVDSVIHQLGGSPDHDDIPLHLQRTMERHHKKALATVHVYQLKPHETAATPAAEQPQEAYAPTRPAPP